MQFQLCPNLSPQKENGHESLCRNGTNLVSLFSYFSTLVFKDFHYFIFLKKLKHFKGFVSYFYCSLKQISSSRNNLKRSLRGYYYSKQTQWKKKSYCSSNIILRECFYLYSDMVRWNVTIHLRG